MSRYRSDTPAARRRDAPLRARRRTRRVMRASLGGYLALCLVALGGIVATAPGPATSVSSAAHSGPAQADPSPPPAIDPQPVRAPDGRVETPDHTTRELPAGWSRVGPILTDAVHDAADRGLEMSVCVLAIDAPDKRRVCVGHDEPRYAASVIKLIFAIGALEAWDGDARAETPYGELDELLTNAITISDNEAANLLYNLTVDGPTAPEEDSPITALNTIADRVGLADEFHTGGAFRELWTGDWSRVSARGGVEFLNELVRAADGRAGSPDADGALTTPAIARTVLDLMLEQERDWKLADRLPAGTVANKTGETKTESHDIGVVSTESGRYAIAVISSAHGILTPADEAIGDLAYEVVGALGGAARF